MKPFWSPVRDALDQGRSVYLSLVVDHSIHSPGTTGARMAVLGPRAEERGAPPTAANVTFLGTVGGGVMEHRIKEAAVAALWGDERPGPTLRRLVHRASGEGEKSGLICAGYQTNLYTLLTPEEHGAAASGAARCEAADEPGWLEVSPEGVHFATGAAQPPQYRFEQADDAWRFVLQLMRLDRVAIFGAGHCGLALSRVVHTLGWHTSVFDTRTDLATLAHITWADELRVVPEYADAARAVRHPEFTDAVVMTTSLTTDIEALDAVLRRPFRFVGVMGSRAKIVAIRKALVERGVPSDALDRLVAPVGLAIGSRTPEEIAVSVAAQLQQERSARLAPSL